MIKIQRIHRKDITSGVLFFDDFECETLELPDLDNAKNISCIPNGLYEWAKIESPSLGLCIDIKNVVNRTYIRIHSGNYTSQIKGCVLVGDSLRDINADGIKDVTNSRHTLDQLMARLPDSGLITFC